MADFFLTCIVMKSHLGVMTYIIYCYGIFLVMISYIGADVYGKDGRLTYDSVCQIDSLLTRIHGVF